MSDAAGSINSARRNGGGRSIDDVVSRLRAVLVADYVVLGEGNGRELTSLPDGACLGDNAHAFTGGRRLWEERGT